MGNMLRSLFENKGNVISDQVVQLPQLSDVDNTDLNRFFDASKAPEESGNTDYYNQKGKLVKHVDDGKTDKFLVLTNSSKSEKVDEAINNGRIIKNPSNELVSKSEDAYDKTESSGKENYFAVGEKGMISKTVEGSEGEITGTQSTEARRDLFDKGDLFSYDVHTHPNEKNSSGELISIGTAIPSETDKTGSDIRINIVLGYSKRIIPPPSNTIGGSSTVEASRTIGFYNSSGSVSTMSFSDFSKIVGKINKK
jgi:hypothetical protein